MDDDVVVWNPNTGVNITTLKDTHDRDLCRIDSMKWGRDSKQLFTVLNSNIHIWCATTGERLSVINGHDLPIRDLVCSPINGYIATGSLDECIHIWNPITGEMVQTIEGYDDMISSISWSPDEKSIVLGSIRGMCRVLDVSTGKLLQTYSHLTNEIDSISWSPNGYSILILEKYSCGIHVLHDIRGLQKQSENVLKTVCEDVKNNIVSFF
jgi:WD40 repeat protein